MQQFETNSERVEAIATVTEGIRDVGKPCGAKGKVRGHRNQRGIISIEAIVVIAIILVLLVWGGSRIGQLFLGTDNTTEGGNVQSLYGAIREIKTAAGYGAAGTDLSATLIAMGKVPGNMAVNGGQILNNWGQAYAIKSTGMGFTLSDPGVPQKSCIKIVSSVSQNGQFDSVSVNSGAASTGAIATATAQAACTTDPSTILWTSTK
ncbi:type 4 pilus major pilin [Burkholderia multivorans]|jgi:type II secretory pathway pseudopilin PulG|uniref:type 4 pilus major pilin n=1 Tax=Burkholderia multivorans TaxID=87883 RepID=UPI0021C1E8F7|nr:type 4 pilus major pilin [Burkholderia multivorans]MDR9051013.1 hypothetical protein [Burkholderia multivorans]MDR9060730.1 hypothetical protein [Burkholderia multivorans]MDR9066745.1 hypothetical protein [Burkholderia multivorans]MDR9078460.1 hypothetical protein [Burkholderia multivorans]MDR9096141.1 hypothetical protein [Burkholderia multivorans]